ncbi:MAG TPA: 2-amino-4-hydroxy-6-hydroxymethyldihydropteridine diphosphokinase [Balneolaceae bacterium]|nr:2-amino-4-hydroxy-6-hydroxymethyldihydropteridine diphosphokinase [Balneolaceae bacterium]
MVTIALGSNKGNRHKHLKEAGRFLSKLSKEKVEKSAVYLTEPVGHSTRYFLNATADIVVDLSPEDLIIQFKQYEKEHGRVLSHSRWGPRTIDLDIISFGDLVINTDSLVIPHVEYNKRLFVLMPLLDLHPDWKDPKTNKSIQQMIEEAESLQIKKTHLDW